MVWELKEFLKFLHQISLEAIFVKNPSRTKSFSLRTVKIGQHQPKGRYTHSKSSKALQLKKVLYDQPSFFLLQNTSLKNYQH
jgi:hypothetical protein